MKKIQNCILVILLIITLCIGMINNRAVKSDYVLNIGINDFTVDVVEAKEEFIEESCGLRTIEQLQGKKLIAFTFDDGPNNATTLKLLEGMKKYNARATFFVVGSRVERHKESLIKAYMYCNQIGNHTYNHYNLKKKKDNVIINEVNKTNVAINNIIGQYPTLIRYPYGSSNEKVRKLGNLPTISWDVDTLDWKYRDSNKIAKKIIDNAHDGAIVLLHDLYETSVDGALLAMEYLSDEYAFVTIEEMALLKQVQLDSTKVYRNFK
ncbi:MAG: polysaccharide deacetylase family protein [Bacilli bacterium]|nr:polysaccharide deacetylase family protein [Bacilli bacterium]